MPNLNRFMSLTAIGLVAGMLVGLPGASMADDDFDIFAAPPAPTKRDFMGFDEEPKPLPPRYLDQRWDQDGKKIGSCLGRARAVLIALTYVDTYDLDSMELYGPGLEELEKSANAGMKRANEAYAQRIRVLRRHKAHLSNFLVGYIEGEQTGYTAVYQLSRSEMRGLLKDGMKDLNRCNAVKRVL
ncbi:MAG: hypothetical protein Alpg2KO_19470 [Alphaproteobacteria bacterium]